MGMANEVMVRPGVVAGAVGWGIGLIAHGIAVFLEAPRSRDAGLVAGS
jgi:hypothetical protein